LRTIARRRAGLDAEEARWLREAERCQLWRELGMVNAIDYLERVFGYSPQTARDRLRIARLLDEMPVLTEALAQGQLPYSAVRELSRVVTPSTEQAWCDAALGKNMRQIEDLVRGHQRGDRPEDPVDPEVCSRIVRLELLAETFALYRQAHQLLDEEHGSHLSDDEFIAALCSSVLDRADPSEPTGRAKFQIALTICKRCHQGWQEGAGVQVAVDASTVERARCDAQEIGSLDGLEPERAHQDVPPSVMRFVWRRDGGRCRVPGCRSSRGLEAHHLVHREHGGSHEASNLILLCSACHTAHHRGKLQIRGTASQLEVERRAEPRTHVGTRSIEVRFAQPRTHVDANPIQVQCEEPPTHVDPRSIKAQCTEPRAHVNTSQIKAQCTEPRAHVDPRLLKVDQHEEPSPYLNPRLIDIRCTEPRTHVDSRPIKAQCEETRTHVDANPIQVQCTEPPAHVELKSRALAASVTRTQAKEALISLGWKPKIAVAAVQAAASTLDEDTALEKLIFEALRRCPRPMR
jgi:hypothetical protein